MRKKSAKKIFSVTFRQWWPSSLSGDHHRPPRPPAPRFLDASNTSVIYHMQIKS